MPTYEDVITFPPIREDIAVVVAEDVPAGSLVEAAREAAGAELREARVFDVYRGEQVGEGKKSVALALVFQSPERTLSDEDAAGLRGRIVALLAERFGAELRGVAIPQSDQRCATYDLTNAGSAADHDRRRARPGG